MIKVYQYYAHHDFQPRIKGQHRPSLGRVLYLLSVALLGTVLVPLGTASPADAASGSGTHAGDSTYLNVGPIGPCLVQSVSYEGTGTGTVVSGTLPYVGPVTVRWNVPSAYHGLNGTYADSNCLYPGAVTIAQASLAGDTATASVLCQWTSGAYQRTGEAETVHLSTADGNCAVTNKVTGMTVSSPTYLGSYGHLTDEGCLPLSRRCNGTYQFLANEEDDAVPRTAHYHDSASADDSPPPLGTMKLEAVRRTGSVGADPSELSLSCGYEYDLTVMYTIKSRRGTFDSFVKAHCTSPMERIVAQGEILFNGEPLTPLMYSAGDNAVIVGDSEANLCPGTFQTCRGDWFINTHFHYYLQDGWEWTSWPPECQRGTSEVARLSCNDGGGFVVP